MESKNEKLIILDFGSQYTQLIARRAREMGVFSLILPFNTSAEELDRHKPMGLVLSGGPNSVYGKNAPKPDPNIWNLGIPTLGICYGLHLMAISLGGKVHPSPNREYGEAKISLKQENILINEAFDDSIVWMSHGDHVAKPPTGFKIVAKSDNVICAIENSKKRMFGFQFHPEVMHTRYGPDILSNFFNLCGFSRNWTTSSIIEEQIAMVKEIAGNHKAVCALSGGVDSSIAATLVDHAIGNQQVCIFVDNGLLRQNEYKEVLEVYKKMNLNVKPIRAKSRFLSKLKGVTDPELKRKIIGNEFIKIFEEEAKKIEGVKYLVQGTLYPDVIESVSVHGPSVTIKSHHNVGGLPKKMNLQLIEPLRNTFKDEVRAIGQKLGLPEQIVKRQAFPGPGLAVRIVGEVTPKRLKLLQQADAIVREEIEKLPEIREQLYQYFAVLLPIKSVGVMGDGRTYEYAVAVKAFHSDDVMTSDWARLPYDLLATISSRIVREVQGINRVVYEITTKPPATIEWE